MLSAPNGLCVAGPCGESLCSDAGFISGGATREVGGPGDLLLSLTCLKFENNFTSMPTGMRDVACFLQ